MPRLYSLDLHSKGLPLAAFTCIFPLCAPMHLHSSASGYPRSRRQNQIFMLSKVLKRCSSYIGAVHLAFLYMIFSQTCHDNPHLIPTELLSHLLAYTPVGTLLLAHTCSATRPARHNHHPPDGNPSDSVCSPASHRIVLNIFPRTLAYLSVLP